MKKIFAVLLLLALVTSGCSSGLTIANIGIPGGAKDASTRDIGKNTQLVYMVDGDMNAACDSQSQLITAAKWTESGEPSNGDTYKSLTYGSGNATLTLMCSEEREDDTLLGTKVTMTLQGWEK